MCVNVRWVEGVCHSTKILRNVIIVYCFVFRAGMKVFLCILLHVSCVCSCACILWVGLYMFVRAFV